MNLQMIGVKFQVNEDYSLQLSIKSSAHYLQEMYKKKKKKKKKKALMNRWLHISDKKLFMVYTNKIIQTQTDWGQRKLYRWHKYLKWNAVVRISKTCQVYRNTPNFVKVEERTLYL